MGLLNPGLQVRILSRPAVIYRCGGIGRRDRFRRDPLWVQVPSPAFIALYLMFSFFFFIILSIALTVNFRKSFSSLLFMFFKFSHLLNRVKNIFKLHTTTVSYFQVNPLKIVPFYMFNNGASHYFFSFAYFGKLSQYIVYHVHSTLFAWTMYSNTILSSTFICSNDTFIFSSFANISNIRFFIILCFSGGG